MLLRKSRKYIASKHTEACVRIALSPWSLYDEIDLKTLFSVVFGATWTEVEIHRFKVLLHHHGEGKWDKISRDMIPCYDRDGKGHVKTPEQCSQFFFLNSYVFFSSVYHISIHSNTNKQIQSTITQTTSRKTWRSQDVGMFLLS